MTKKITAFAALVVLLLSQRPHAQGPAGPARIYFVDVGTGASTLIVSPTGKTLLVDGGPPGSGTKISSLLTTLGISTIDYTVLTHYHIDHIGGIKGLADAYDIEVWAPRGEAARLREHETAPYEPQHLLDGDETVGIAGIEFRTFSVPGHSPASIAYATEGIVFSGDILFAGCIGRTDLEGGDMDTLVASIGRLMDALPGETIVASGHGPATTLERERQTNPFLGALRS